MKKSKKTHLAQGQLDLAGERRILEREKRAEKDIKAQNLCRVKVTVGGID